MAALRLRFALATLRAVAVGCAAEELSGDASWRVSVERWGGRRGVNGEMFLAPLLAAPRAQRARKYHIAR